jgi:hypothetical protein
MLQRLKRLLRRTFAVPVPVPVAVSPNDAAIADSATLRDAHLSGWFRHESGEFCHGKRQN